LVLNKKRLSEYRKSPDLIIGIGIDIEEIPRIKKAYKQKNFLRQFNLSRQSSNKVASDYPSDYCILEALFKALGCPFDFTTKNISIVRVNGRPQIEMLDISSNYVFNFKTHVSVSHVKNLVICIVIVESINE
jgi:phosphopantetheine--protein transferase-like protein